MRPSCPVARRQPTPSGQTFLYGQPNASRLWSPAMLQQSWSQAAFRPWLHSGCTTHCRVAFFGGGFVELETRWESVTLPVTAGIPLADDLLAQVHLCADKGFGPCSQDQPESSGPTFEGYISRPTSGPPAVKHRRSRRCHSGEADLRKRRPGHHDRPPIPGPRRLDFPFLVLDPQRGKAATSGSSLL